MPSDLTVTGSVNEPTSFPAYAAGYFRNMPLQPRAESFPACSKSDHNVLVDFVIVGHNHFNQKYVSRSLFTGYEVCISYLRT
jgi:hypothetical protein